MEWLLERLFLFPKRTSLILAVALVLAGVFAWWQFIWQSPARVFDDMLAGNLQTTSVTKTISVGNGTQSVDQTVRLQMGGTNAADWLVFAKQNGTSVGTESIGTPTAGYLRYIQINTGTKHGLDFSGVTNVWGKSDGKTDASLGDLYSQTLLDITSAPTLPIGNLSAGARENLLAFNRDEKVFTPDFGKVKQETVGQRPVYTYSVAVRLQSYVRLMQLFAHDVGLKSLDTVDPNQYAGLSPVTITVSVDRLSHQLVKISYGNSGFLQTYGDWGLLTPITVPSHTITTTELQQRLQSLSITHS